MKIGILQTGHSPDVLKDAHGTYDQMFARLLDGHGFEFEVWNVVDEVFPDSIQDADGWLITGSKHGAYEDHAWIPPLEDFIRDTYADGRPMIGICFGHQIIAQALGGTVEKFAGGWSVGRKEYEINGQTMAVNAWHQDQVTSVPEGAVTIGSNDFCAHAALIYDNRVLSYQPHPEFQHGFVDGLIRTRGKGVVPDDVLAEAAQKLEQPLDSRDVAQQMAAFFKRKGTGNG